MELTAEQLVELLTVLGGVDQGGTKERRAYPRIGLGDPVVIRPVLGEPDSGRTGRPIRGLLRDVSATGVGITCPCPFAEGQSFVVELRRADGSSLEIRCVVVACSMSGPGGFKLGGEFSEAWLEREAAAMAWADSSVD